MTRTVPTPEPLDMEGLYYEIANCAFVEAHLMPADQENARHTVADICQEGNRDRVDSVIRLALAELHLPPPIALRNPHAREYIIGCVLADWLGIAKPEAAERWRLRAAEALPRARCLPVFSRKIPPF